MKGGESSKGQIMIWQITVLEKAISYVKEEGKLKSFFSCIIANAAATRTALLHILDLWALPEWEPRGDALSSSMASLGEFLSSNWNSSIMENTLIHIFKW